MALSFSALGTALHPRSTAVAATRHTPTFVRAQAPLSPPLPSPPSVTAAACTHRDEDKVIAPPSLDVFCLGFCQP